MAAVESQLWFDLIAAGILFVAVFSASIAAIDIFEHLRSQIVTVRFLAPDAPARERGSSTPR